MTREDPQMKIRLPQDLKTLIEATAGDAGRSLNAEIISRLADSFEVRADATQLEIQVETLKMQLDSYKGVAQVSEAMQKLLAGSLIAAIDELPAKSRAGFVAIRAFAEALRSGDVRAIGTGLIVLMRDDPALADAIREIMQETETAVAGKEKKRLTAKNGPKPGKKS